MRPIPWPRLSLWGIWSYSFVVLCAPCTVKAQQHKISILAEVNATKFIFRTEAQKCESCNNDARQSCKAAVIMLCNWNDVREIADDKSTIEI
ncbi:hypothetical protein AVEN_75777-1 [Araneus ventricosus]|uniref:Secreted protein n=1 Tax=Araneus ventricosus TaxID=182803 RepID=A0A4Y2L5C6_ARAVE|nr:hypothetical protein AVEN_75777-1 [Araneus ventricosus]